jgi:hypothetical protein
MLVYYPSYFTPVLLTCSSLITIVHDGKSRVVQFSHFSVQEFQTSDRLAAATPFHHIPLEPAHTIFAQACLSILLRLDDSTGKPPCSALPWLTTLLNTGLTSTMPCLKMCPHA